MKNEKTVLAFILIAIIIFIIIYYNRRLNNQENNSYKYFWDKKLVKGYYRNNYLIDTIIYFYFIASAFDDFCGVQEALSNSVNVNYQDTNGETALIIGKIKTFITNITIRKELLY